MKVLITGATGLIGKEIVRLCLAKNISVNYLTTSKNKITSTNNYKGFYWNPFTQEIDTACFEGVDAIINLAGASISKRWTSSYKKQILESRLQSLQLLKQTIETKNISIKHILSASAIGVYLDSLVNYYTEESSEYSSSFLGEVVKKWEAKLDEFSSLGIKVSKIRIGLVLDAKEGALPKITQPIKFGFGAAFGTGEQWQSWIHIKDLAHLFLHVVEQNLEGVFNGVAPNPVTNKELTKAIAKAVRRPLILPNIPKFVMKISLGEMHTLLFESQRVSSQKVENTNFHFKFHNIQPALEDLL